MKTIATLGPSVRLVVIQFLVNSAQVPAVVPRKRESETPSLPMVSGKEVLESTSPVYLINFLEGIIRPSAGQSSYRLVDAWFTPSLRHFGKSMVRYVFCHNIHVKTGEPHPDFVANYYKLFSSLLDLVGVNLWAVQGHLNPYFEKDGSKTDHQVLMLGCAGRKPTIDSTGNALMVFRDGRNAENRGVGPKVSIVEKAHRLMVMSNNDTVLTDSDLALRTVSASVA